MKIQRQFYLVCLLLIVSITGLSNEFVAGLLLEEPTPPSINLTTFLDMLAQSSAIALIIEGIAVLLFLSHTLVLRAIAAARPETENDWFAGDRQ